MSSLTGILVNNLLFSYAHIDGIASFIIFYFNLIMILFICGVPMVIAKSIFNMVKVTAIHLYDNFDFKINDMMDKKNKIMAVLNKNK